MAAAPAPTASDAPDVGNPCTTAIATGTPRKPLPSSTLNGSPVIPKYRWSYDRMTSSSSQSRSGSERPALPGEHDGVALHHLEQRGEDRLGERRRAGEPAARRVRDRACAPSPVARGRRSRPGGTPRFRRRARCPGRTVAGVSSPNSTNGNLGSASCVGWKRAKRAGRTAASPSAAAVVVRTRSSGTKSAEYRSSASPIAAARARAGSGWAPLPKSTVARPSVRRADASSLAQFGRHASSVVEVVESVCVTMPTSGDTASSRFGERVVHACERPIRQRRGHAIASCHGDGTARTGVPQDAQRGTRSSRSNRRRTIVPQSSA